MYPLTRWSPKEVVTRLELLADAGFHQESIVASVQVLEQALKRILRSHMVQKRIGVTKRRNQLITFSAKSKEEIDDALRHHAQSIDAIRTTWRAALGKESLGLSETLDAIGGPTTWTALFSKKPTRVRAARGTVEVPYGLNRMRHLLIHGRTSPPRADIEQLATLGSEVVARILVPEEWERHGHRSPFRRVFPFRKRGSAT